MKNSIYNVEFQKMYYLLKASAKQSVTVVVLQSTLLKHIEFKTYVCKALKFAT